MFGKSKKEIARMLDANLKAQLKSYLERVTQPIEIVASLDDGAKSQEMLELLKDVASLSNQITLIDNGDDARKPSFSINRPGADISLRFAGIPMGHEFTSLVLALLQVGGHPSKASAEPSSRSVRSPVSSTSRPTSRSPARTARTWSRR
jgi:alkyl hydroperoxide reductase subunit F